MIFILNLDRSKRRKEKLTHLLKNRGIEDYKFFPAFEGKHLTNLTFNANIGMGYGAGRQFQKAELAIIMSHLAAIKTAKMMELENIIILEDDVMLCMDWNSRIETLHENLPENWEYVYLSGHSDYVKFQVYDQPKIIKAPRMVGAFSYMVNHTAYDKIIKACTSFMTTFDDMILNEISQGRLNGYTYFPFMTYHDAEESLIWGKTASVHSSKKFFKSQV